MTFRVWRATCLISSRYVGCCAFWKIDCLGADMDVGQQQSLLALLEWEERLDWWLEVSAESREHLVRELARLMVRVAAGEHVHDI